MASSQGVENVGALPGKQFYIQGKDITNNIKEFTFSKTFKHMITNSMDEVRVWDATAYTWKDGMFRIPYDRIRASMNPSDIEFINMNFDAASVVETGFKVIGCKAQEMEVSNDALGNRVKAIDVATPVFETFIDPTGWWSDMSTFANGEDDFRVNNDMKEVQPESRNTKMLNTSYFAMGPAFKSAYPVGSYFNSTDNPPFEWNRMLNKMPGSLVGWSLNHRYGLGFSPTALCEVSGRDGIGAIKPTSQPNPWLTESNRFPGVCNTERWTVSNYDPYAQRNVTRSTPPVALCRMNRAYTRGGPVDYEAEIGVTYHCTIRAITQKHHAFYTDHSGETNPIGVSPWDRAYRRRYVALSGRQLEEYASYATFNNNLNVTPKETQEKDEVDENSPQAKLAKLQDDEEKREETTTPPIDPKMVEAFLAYQAQKE